MGAPGGGMERGGGMDRAGGMRPEFGRGDAGGGMRPNGGGYGMGGGAVHAPHLGPPGRWWDDKHVSRALNLRPDQQRRMDDIFEANKGQLLGLYENLQREEQRLSTMSSADLQDESKIFAGIDRVAQARAELYKENAHILLQIRRELDGEQLSRLDKETAAAR